jgi:hypothetical protein
MDSLLELFCDVDDFCLEFVPIWRRRLLSSGEIQSHRTAWLNNDWMVADCDQQARWVKFVRGRPGNR